jgi:homoserine kinase
MEIARAQAFAPASMGNFGVAFDVIGVAFAEPGDIVCAEWNDAPGVVITAIQGDGGQLPRDPARNTAGVAANSVLQRLGARRGVRLTVHKGLPLASGLGSSAASAVAAAVAVNALFGEPLPREDLLPACLDGEAVVSGYHPDNVGPSLLGGITMITGSDLREIRRLPVPETLRFALVTPDVAVSTAVARAVLPQTVSLRALVAQTGAVARLVDALHRGDLEAMAGAMERDGIIEPARAHLIPLLAEARTVAKRAGALGLVISGAGPTLCAVCDSDANARQVAAALGALYDEAGIANMTRATGVSTCGARVLAVE